MSAEVTRHVAIDLGASSGRVALGTVGGGRLTVEVLHRFPNGGVPVNGGLQWDVLGLWREVLRGLTLAAAHGEIASVGVNSWAVDYGLLDAHGELLGGVHHYRSPRLDGVMERIRAELGEGAIYGATGIQFLPFNTLYQLAAERPERVAAADTLLLVPDLLHFWLCGARVTERTNASTTQLYDPHSGGWAWELVDAAGIPRALLPRIVEPGTDLGPLRLEVAAETGLGAARVIAPATHDTASAVAAVPATGEGGWAYVSSGTWSLVGVESPRPVLTDAARALNLTNEAGIGGTTRLLKNVMGLWIVQECRRAWNADFAELYAGAAALPAGGPVIDPDDARFLAPGTDMPARVQAACRGSGQPVPRTPPEIVRCVLDSLAQRIAEVLDGLEAVTGTAIHTLYVVGGGSQGDLLNQLTADATGRPVVAGPVEATLMGNLLVQARACGSVAGYTIRDVVRASSDLQTFVPGVAPARATRHTGAEVPR
ncbi:rhamnulokinase [Deinococcus metalli]|uniref:Carbohydrate kinase n=1 Tax=Deinococcus metalli TaxID=1141878 RepID=A0A7W8KCM7_9DEIO|nr:rhamnulokinase family protein [Deinococcus metalli]MBB5375747.1 rhamnulokinase [Deinococcus metalli]GHF37362.1 carbohydrate kinase [Deinococcus metalli]